MVYKPDVIAEALQSFWLLADITLCYYFSFQTVPLFAALLLVSNAQCIGLSLLLLISHLYTWVDRSSSIYSPPPTFSHVLRARQLWKQCGICATGRENRLVALTLTRFSRDIRGKQKTWHPSVFHRSKLHPITLMRDWLWIKGRGEDFWMASLRLKWGDT